jgi:hypothetical protein
MTKFDYAETCVFRAAIDAHDAHAGSLYEFSWVVSGQLAMDRVGNGSRPRNPWGNVA